MKTWKQLWYRSLLAAACGGVFAVVSYILNTWLALDMAERLSRELRKLSLSGVFGNLAAWGIVLVVSLLPALGLLVRKRKRADLLLLLLGVELFAGVFFLANPTLMFPVSPIISGYADSWWLLAKGCIFTTFAAWVLLRLLDLLEQAPGRLLPDLCFWIAVIYGFLSGRTAILTILTEITSITDDYRLSLIISSAVVIVLYNGMKLVLILLPNLILLWARDLVIAVNSSPFAEETVKLADTTAHRCSFLAKISLIAAVFCNLFCVVTAPISLKIEITFYFPLRTLALCAALFLLCSYFRRAKAVSDDNDSII